VRISSGLLWKNRQLRHQLYLLRARYHLAVGGFATGLGRSAWVLHGLVRSLRPESCVEIGSAQGWSTCHIALALKENSAGRLYAIDPHTQTTWNDAGPTDTYAIIQDNLHKCGVAQYVAIVRATSEAAAQEWTQPIDFLFVDGDHSYAGVKRDWELFSPFLTEFGVAVFHDTTWERHGPNRSDMGVPRFVEELRRQGYPVITLDRDCGLSLVQKIVGGVPLLPPNP
jgi:predicted O-methyltransferase YrrM